MSDPIRQTLCREAAELCESLIEALLTARTDWLPSSPEGGHALGACLVARAKFWALDPSGCAAPHRFAFRELKNVLAEATAGPVVLTWETNRLIAALHGFRHTIAGIERPDQTAETLAAARLAALPGFLKRAYREYVRAGGELGPDATPKERHAWLGRNASDGYDLPVIQTFLSYIRRAEREAGLRAVEDSGPGRSIVRRHEI